MASFCEALLDAIDVAGAKTMAWCVLPNHYHALIETTDVLAALAELGQLHGRISFEWNGETNTRRRKVWFRAVERAMRSERHYWATRNYTGSSLRMKQRPALAREFSRPMALSHQPSCVVAQATQTLRKPRL